MDKNTFNEKILAVLEAWKFRGESIHTKGARLIGHVPEIAEKAYMHVIFPPLEERHISELKDRLAGRVIPDSYLSLLKLANGMYLFPGEITIHGYIPLNKEKSKSFFDNPSNIMIDNGQLMVKGSESSDITIGWYQSDGSYINIKCDGRVIRFKPEFPMQIINVWPTLTSWLIEEITRLNIEWQRKINNLL